jgi:hypothetical protein
MRRCILFLLLLVPILGGCVSAVTLRNPETGAEVTCGPYAAWEFVGPSSAWGPKWEPGTRDRQTRCIEEYETRGYVREGA